MVADVQWKVNKTDSVKVGANYKEGICRSESKKEGNCTSEGQKRRKL